MLHLVDHMALRHLIPPLCPPLLLPPLLLLLQPNPVLSLSHSRVVRVLVAWAPRIMRLLGVEMPKRGLILKVSPEGKVVQVRLGFCVEL
jgi:hypothetical protein